MNLRIFIDFWNARERRERSLLVSALLVFVLILLITFFTKAYSSISIQNRALESAKNDFYYVFDKAENAEILQSIKTNY